MICTAALIALLGAQDMSQYDQRWIPNNQRVIAWMEKHVDQSGQIVLPRPIEDAGLADLTRTVTFHTVHYMEFPVARMAPKPMAMRNVFSVDGKWNVALYTKREELRKVFPSLVKAVNKPNMKVLALGWLRVSTEFSQDGFFQFLFDEKNLSLAPRDNGYVMTAVAPVVEKGGDRGKLTATLTFAPDKDMGMYRLVSIVEKDTIQPGVRPICQATLLLDDNPLVRRIAERDLLVMGKAALPYMEEQMAKASPELRKEIERVRKRIENGDR